MKLKKDSQITILILFCILIYGAALLSGQKTKCSNNQLHEVIQQVEKCNKHNAICSSDDKDKILKDVCK